jgi:hypothetical protein
MTGVQKHKNTINGECNNILFNFQPFVCFIINFKEFIYTNFQKEKEKHAFTFSPEVLYNVLLFFI